MDAVASVSLQETSERLTDIDWAERWSRLIKARHDESGGHRDPSYWDRRAPTFARSTNHRVDGFMEVVAPYLSARKTLIDVGAGAGRHALPLAERLEWVTAVEPSEGMRAQIPARDNMTVVASGWEEAEVAPADLVICSHVMYGVAEPVPFLTKLDRSARERVFVMMREGPVPHPASAIRERMRGGQDPRSPQFSDLFGLLMQMRIAPDVDFLRYAIVYRWTDLDDALADCKAFVGTDWDEAIARATLEELLTIDGNGLVFDAGTTLSGVAHWQPRI